MGWRELQAWIAEHNRSVQQARDGAVTSPSHWNGRDEWWQEQDRRRREGR